MCRWEQTTPSLTCCATGSTSPVPSSSVVAASAARAPCCWTESRSPAACCPPRRWTGGRWRPWRASRLARIRSSAHSPRTTRCSAASARRASSLKRPHSMTGGGWNMGGAEPTDATIAAALAGHLCRCAAYPAIYQAVRGACAGRFDAAGAVSGPRVEAPAKVTGAARYTVDIHQDGQLEGLIVRSPHPHARVLAVDLVACPGARRGPRRRRASRRGSDGALHRAGGRGRRSRRPCAPRKPPQPLST